MQDDAALAEPQQSEGRDRWTAGQLACSQHSSQAVCSRVPSWIKGTRYALTAQRSGEEGVEAGKAASIAWWRSARMLASRGRRH